MEARGDMLVNRGDWPNRLPVLLEQLSALSDREAGIKEPKFLPLFKRSARLLLEEFTALPAEPDNRTRLRFFERSYRFIKVGNRLFSGPQKRVH